MTVTYAQLEAESWWGREVVTDALDWLGDTLCTRYGRPRTAFGAKGDNAHLRGAHRSQEWIKNSKYATSRTYTVQSGLTTEQTRYIGGADFAPGSATEMLTQSRRIWEAVRSGQLEEVHEFYGNIDGDHVVDGWNNIGNKLASADNSHLWHWHLTIDRSLADDMATMRKIYAIVTGENNMAVDGWKDPCGFAAYDGGTRTHEQEVHDVHAGLMLGDRFKGDRKKAYLPNVVADTETKVDALVKTLTVVAADVAALKAQPPVQLDYDQLAAALLRHIATPQT